MKVCRLSQQVKSLYKRYKHDDRQLIGDFSVVSFFQNHVLQLFLSAVSVRGLGSVGCEESLRSIRTYKTTIFHKNEGD